MAKVAGGKHRYFQPSANEIMQLFLLLFVIVVAGGSFALTKIFSLPYITRQNIVQQQPIYWTRVNNLQQFVYFNHSIHVAKGVGCASCHGRVDEMDLTNLRQKHPKSPMPLQFILLDYTFSPNV